MPEQHAQIHFVSGEKIEVPGTVPEVHSKLIAGHGALVALKNRRGDDVIVNPEHVESIQQAPNYSSAGFR